MFGAGIWGWCLGLVFGAGVWDGEEEGGAIAPPPIIYPLEPRGCPHPPDS